MKNERYIIVGASGLIGGEIYRHLTMAGRATIGTAYTQASPKYLFFDMTKQSLLDLIPDLCSSDVVILMGAKTDLNWIYLNTDMSRRINVDFTITAIDCAHSRGAKIIYPSSENVFDGRKFGYDERDAPNPLTLYGKQKFEVENYITKSNGSYLIARFGWNICVTQRSRGPIETLYSSLLEPDTRIAFDNYFTVTHVTDSAVALIKLINSRSNGIYHIAANPPISRANLADMIMNVSKRGSLMSYKKISFSSLELPEPRPKSAWLKNDKLHSAMDLDFLSVHDLVQMKVAFLDRKLNCN